MQSTRSAKNNKKGFGIVGLLIVATVIVVTAGIWLSKQEVHLGEETISSAKTLTYEEALQTALDESNSDICDEISEGFYVGDLYVSPELSQANCKHAYAIKKGVEIISEDTIQQEVVLRGVVRGIIDGCGVDGEEGICSFIIGDYTAVWSSIWGPLPRGSMDDDIKIGDTVEVFGRYVGYDNKLLSIYGSNKYYIKSVQDRVTP